MKQYYTYRHTRDYVSNPIEEDVTIFIFIPSLYYWEELI